MNGLTPLPKRPPLSCGPRHFLDSSHGAANKTRSQMPKCGPPSEVLNAWKEARTEKKGENGLLIAIKNTGNKNFENFETK